mgnify:FL=1|jgi:Gpi18-like mannosyltransferase
MRNIIKKEGEVALKRISAVFLIINFLFLVGCSYQDESMESKKQSRIEIYSVEDKKLLKTIDDQIVVNELFSTYNWEEKSELSDDLIPEYQLLVYQEKTMLWGQDPDKDREYELIATITTFLDSSYIEEVISSDVVKNMKIPEYAMTFYYIMPDKIMEVLHEQLEE